MLMRLSQGDGKQSPHGPRVGHLLLGCAHGGIIEGEMWAYHSQFSVA